MDDFENKHFVKIPQNNEITKKILEENNVVPLSEHYEENKDEQRGKILIILNKLVIQHFFIKYEYLNVVISQFLSMRGPVSSTIM